MKMPALRAFFWSTVRSITAQSTLMKHFQICVLATVTLLLGHAQAQTGPQLDLPRVTLSAGIHQVDTQVAQTPEQRATGLMFRREMPQAEGMLFVFEQASVQC